MDLLQLRYFCHAASTESFTKTAQEFHVPASNISQCIRRLEKELGTSLFDRSPNRIKLNMQGKTFYQSTKQAMDLIDYAANTVTGRLKHSVRVKHFQGRGFVLRMLNSYMEQFPEVEVSANRDYSDSLQNCDIILAADRAAPEGFSGELAVREPMILIAPKGTLPESGSVSPDFLKQHPFITSEANRHTYHKTIQICEELGFRPRIALQLEHTESIPVYVSQGRGMAILPYQSWRQTFDDSTMEIRVIPGHYRDLYMYQKKRQTVAPHIDQFCKILKKILAEAQEERPHYPSLRLH